MQEPMLKINSDLSKTIGFTTEYFEGGTIYNLLPIGIYISWLTPKSEEALEQMFNLIDQKKLLFRYTAPQDSVRKFLIKRGYYLAVDTANTPYFCNFTPKKNVVTLVRPLDNKIIIDSKPKS